MTINSDAENRQAKLDFMRAFFNDLDNKINFLSELYRDHRDEAKVLCSCYIDALSVALYWPDERNKFNFVRVLKEYGGEEIFLYIHPKKLEDALAKLITRSSKWKAIKAKTSQTLQQARGRLYTEQEIFDLLFPLLNNSEQENIKKELWRGSFAAIVYSEVRIPSVHWFGPPDGVTFDNTTFRGQPVPSIEFVTVYPCLKRIASIAREKSLITEKWFGHDFE